jgi:hypothetical protein
MVSLRAWRPEAADVLLEKADRGCSTTPVERELAFGFAGSFSSNVLDLLSSVDKILRSLATSDFKGKSQLAYGTEEDRDGGDKE